MIVTAAPVDSPLVTVPTPVTCSIPSATMSVYDRLMLLAWPLSQAMSYGVFVARLGMARQEAPGRETVTANSPLASVGSVDMQWAKVSVSV
jgi:hypothetical protein